VTTSATAPHLIMTYCALLALAVLRDDYALLDRAALKRMVGACQVADGGCVIAYTVPSFLSACDEHYAMARVWVSTRFVTMPGADDADLRMTYCAFVVCALLGDWSCIDLSRALSYIRRCRVRVLFSPLPSLLSSLLLCCMHGNHQTYEGGYGQTPQGESLGGPTYCAVAALHLVPADHACAPQARLQRAEWHATVRWLVHMQVQTLASVGGGGFAGRTSKLADACYGFWCGAALAVRADRYISCVRAEILIL
jgi:geranylgeranyl transferase type-1 subunit beta